MSEQKNDFYAEGESYDIPSDSGYMSFEEGDNRFRILGTFRDNSAIRGTSYWKTMDGVRRPIRLKPNVPVPMNELEMNKFGELDRPRYFWALPVYNYQAKKIQILEINQKTVLEIIKKQIENPKWGDPRAYDFIVTRTEEKGKTKYSVTNDPKEPMDPGIVQLYQDMQINTAALYDGGNPFATSEGDSDRSTPKAASASENATTTPAEEQTVDADEADAAIDAKPGAEEAA